MKNKFRAMMLIIVCIMVGIIIYNLINNYSVKVVTTEVEVENLPEEFEGFTILQLADLHSKNFGKNQERLTSVINELKFDIVSITGDMQNRQDKNAEPFINLINKIDNKENIFYTPGNHGPLVYKNEVTFNSFTESNIYEENKFKEENNNVGYKSEEDKLDLKNKENELTDVGIQMKNLGVKFLDEVYYIERGNSKLWISELIYENKFNELSKNNYKDNDIKIAITHYPFNKASYEGDIGRRLGNYDLIMSGHYHGGQWRIPFIGGLFIPDLNESGFFPSQERVSGLTTWGGFKQYVSKGIGAGGPFKILRFRLFNKPEIDLIKLVRK